tara:strand:- start:1519 stop:1710 length:192 start_codon:yes stop_codon:yes gene_type:complete
MTNPLEFAQLSVPAIAEQIRRLNEEDLRKLCYILDEDNMADKLSIILDMVFTDKALIKGDGSE